MATLEVYRRRPPEVQRCLGKGCRRLVEWVTTAAHGRQMPVTHPLTPVREHECEGGRFLTVIEADSVHFNTCPAAAKFRKPSAPRSQPTRSRARRPTQGALFKED